MGKKALCFIGQNETTCDYISQALTRFFGAYITISSWCLNLGKQPANLDEFDVFVTSSKAVLDQVRRELPDQKSVLVAARTINIENLDRLLELSSGTRAIVVGSSEETTLLAISIIKEFGFSHLSLVPYYPDCPHEIPEDIRLAITMGLAHLVPPHIENLVELGTRGIDLSTLTELVGLFHMPLDVLNEISNYYIIALINLGLRRQKIANLNESLKREIEVVINTISEAIIAVNKANEIVAMNPEAEKVFKLNRTDALGKNAADIVSSIDFSTCLKTGKGMSDQIVMIHKSHYIVTANPITDESSTINGVAATFRPVKEVQELATRVRRQLKIKGHVARYTFNDIVGTSDKLQSTILLAKKFSKTDLTILLEGESGTGKELFSQAIHNYSPRNKGPFVALNFAALPENLVESELFGYESGAFSGARKEGKSGLFEEAHQGTIFLDEIGDASLDVQKKLLRVLEEREVRRVGGSTITPIDVRVIAATNIDLRTLVEQKKFRHDLFFRLYTVPIPPPPLRSIKEDIPLLVKSFARRIYARNLKTELALDNFLKHYQWPGNVRELQNVVSYLCNVADENDIATCKHLPSYLLTEISAIRSWQDEEQPAVSKKDEMLLAELTSHNSLKDVAAILYEIQKVSAFGKSIGRLTLMKRLQDSGRNLSEHTIRHWLKVLDSNGYVRSGITRQGSIITLNGEHFLTLVRNNHTHPQQ